MGTMTMFLTKAFPSFHFKGNYLIAFHLVDDLGFDGGLYVCTYRQFVVGIYQEHFSEFQFIACLPFNMRNLQCLVFLDLELLTGYFYNC
jgi:hypothetical protein